MNIYNFISPSTYQLAYVSRKEYCNTQITGFIEVCMEKTSVAVPKIKKTGEFCLS